LECSNPVDENGKVGAFPFCLVNSIASPFKITGSLNDMMDIYWRVKRWKVTASGGFTLSCPGVDGEGTPFLAIYTYLFSGANNLINSYNIPTQNSLVCGRPTIEGDESDSPIIATLLAGGLTFGDSGGVGVFGGFRFFDEGIAKNEDSTYSTNFHLNLGFYGFSVYMGTGYSNAVYYPVTIGSIEFKLNNKVISNVPLSLATFAPGGLVTCGVSPFLKLVIEPGEYWGQITNAIS
jgi:hypothetical protein